MRYFPLCLDIRDRICLLVGGGGMALEKATRLLQAGARVRVVAPDCRPEFSGRADVEVRLRAFEDTDLDGVFLAIAATHDRILHERFARLCVQRGILHSVIDAPDLCQFIAPAIVERGELMLGVSTQGLAPALAARLRAEIEAWLPADIEEYLHFLDHARQRAKKMLARPEDRASLGRRLASREGHERFAALSSEQRRAWVDALIESHRAGGAQGDSV